MIFKLLMSAWTNKIPPCIAIRTYLFAWYPPPLAPPVARRIITDNICANEKSTAHVVAHFTTYKHHNPLDSARLQMLLFCVWGFQPENCDTASQNYLSFCLDNIFVRKARLKGEVKKLKLISTKNDALTWPTTLYLHWSSNNPHMQQIRNILCY